MYGLVAAMCWSVAAAPIVAQDSIGGVPFVLRTPASIRFAGFNGAGAALVGHPGTVFTNPAGLATIRHIALEGGYQTAPGEGNVLTAAVGWRLRQFDLGFGVQHYDLGLGGGLGPLLADATETLSVGSLVYRFGLIALGVSGKFLRQKRGEVREDGVSGDIGLAIAVFDIMALGFAVQNVGGNWESASAVEMKRLTRTGFTMNYVDPQGTFRLLSTIEWQWPAGEPTRFVIGGEGGIVLGQVGVVGRVAYGSHSDAPERSAFTFGASLELGWVDVDASYEPNEIDDTPIRRLGVRFAL